MPLQIRRGTSAQRLSITPLPGELIYDTSTGEIFVGNGTTPGGVVTTGISLEDARDEAASLFTSGSHTGISFSYDDANNRLNAAVTSEFIQDRAAELLTNGVHNGITFNYVDGSNRIDATITSISNGTFDGDLTGSVFADNSSIIINAIDRTVTANSVGAAIYTNLNTVEDVVFRVADPGSILFENSTGNCRVKFIQNTYSTSFNDAILFAQSHENQDAININFYRSRGTYTSPAANIVGDEIAELTFFGHGTARRTAGSITWEITGAATTTGIPAKLVVRAHNGTINNEVLNIGGDGILKVNSISTLTTLTSTKEVRFSSPLTLHSYANAAARDLDITSPVAGTLAYLADAGSGTPGVSVYFGAPTNSWKILTVNP